LERNPGSLGSERPISKTKIIGQRARGAIWGEKEPLRDVLKTEAKWDPTRAQLAKWKEPRVRLRRGHKEARSKKAAQKKGIQKMGSTTGEGEGMGCKGHRNGNRSLLADNVFLLL